MTTIARRLDRLERLEQPHASDTGAPRQPATHADWLAIFEEDGRRGFSKDADYAAALAAYRNADHPCDQYDLWAPLAEHSKRLWSALEGEEGR
jgi:hypothetical protein